MYEIIYSEEADKDFPDMGFDSKYKELLALGIKILPFEKYLIFHTVNKRRQTVNIIRVLRGSVNYRRLF